MQQNGIVTKFDHLFAVRRGDQFKVSVRPTRLDNYRVADQRAGVRPAT